MNTIQESFTLPSKGLIYDKKVNPEFTLRSMTTIEEMKRLSPTKTPYLTMCEIIEDCLLTDLGIPVKDLCLGDYQFMMHKLRIVSYGTEYRMTTRCPYCNEIEEQIFNLEDLDVNEYDPSMKSMFTVELPRTGKTITLRYQTPAMLENINKQKNARLKKDSNSIDPTFELTLEALIEEVDGEVLDPIRLENFVQKLPVMDAKVIFDAAEKINSMIGLDTVVVTQCGNPRCQKDYTSTFRPTSEFFWPTL